MYFLDWRGPERAMVQEQHTRITEKHHSEVKHRYSPAPVLLVVIFDIGLGFKELS